MRLRPTVEEQLWRNELDNNNKLENKASEMLRIRTSPAPHRSAYGHRNLCNHKYIETGHILSLPHPHDLPLYIPPPPSLYSLSAWSQECLHCPHLPSSYSTIKKIGYWHLHSILRNMPVSFSLRLLIILKSEVSEEMTQWGREKGNGKTKRERKWRKCFKNWRGNCDVMPLEMDGSEKVTRKAFEEWSTAAVLS